MKMNIKKWFNLCLALLLASTLLTISMNAQSGLPMGGVLSLKAGNSLREAQEYKKAEYYLRRGLSRVKAAKNKYWEASAYEFLGLLYRDLENNFQAEINFGKAEKLYQEIGMNLSARVAQSLKENARGDIAYFAGIEVGSRGVKGAIVAMQPGEKGNFVYEIKYDDSKKNPGTIEGTEAAIKETAEAVGYYYNDWIKNTVTGDSEIENIDGKDIMIAISSGVKQSLEEKGTLDDLVLAIQERIGDRNKEIRIVDSCEEPRLVGKGTIPASSRYITSIFDIGSGNTKGGYIDWGTDAFSCSSFEFGSVSLTKQIQEKANEEGINYLEAAKRIEPKVKEAIQSEFRRLPGFKDRKYACLVGGIVWAFVTYNHPERRDERLVTFNLEEIKQFKKDAIHNYDRLTNPDLSELPENILETVEGEVNLIRSRIFNQENLIAGAIILEALVEEYTSSIKSKELYFARDGYVGWITGYIIETISARYEDPGKELDLSGTPRDKR